jgi:hypothetical protein
MGRSDYERQPAPEFLFQRRQLRHGRHIAVRAGEAVLVVGNQPPHRVMRREERVIRRDDAPNLTVTSDPNNSVAVVGGGADWNVFFWAEAGGQTKDEADERLRRCSFSVRGSTVSISGPNLYEGHDVRSELLVEAPHDAGVVIHGSYAAVEVCDLAGPVRIAATHARASILDTTGQVDATAGCVDFAGSCGRVTLSAEQEINLKITARKFDGTLLAWAQRSVRMLVPPEFSTPFEAIVGSHDDFVCRAEFRSKVKQNRQGELYVFTYGVSADDRSRAGLHLRSEASTVVIDQPGENR